MAMAMAALGRTTFGGGSPNATSRPFSPGHSAGSVGTASPGKFKTRRRLPREGPSPGDGTLTVHDPAVLETLQNLDTAEAEPPAGKGPASAGGSSKGGRPAEAATQRPAAPSESEHGSTSGMDAKEKPRLSPEERRKAEIASKWEKTEAIREKDQKQRIERMEQRRDMREARFQRLLNNITCSDGLAYKTAIAMRDRDARVEQRRRDLHAAWEEKVFAPIASQADAHMNPPNRAREQALTGSKSVCWNLPGARPRLVVNQHEDPARKSIVDAARENAFHSAAEYVLRGSHSAPNLRAPCPDRLVPLALSRPTLEPTHWGQVALQGTIFGQFAQIAEHGEGFKRARRGGVGIHIPDTTDGVPPAGTRLSRTKGRNDMGILKGDTATRGEGATYRNEFGASSIAPAQDHYTFEMGEAVTDLEFPKGKRIMKEFH